MASIASVKGGARKGAAAEAKAKPKASRRPVDNDRTETPGRFAWVVMMPIVIAALVALIMFYLTLPLR